MIHLFVPLLPPQNGLVAPASHQVYVRKPVWVHLGRNASNAQVWARIDSEDDPAEPQFNIYVGKKLVKSKLLDTDLYFTSDGVPTVARIGRNWMLFFDTHSGAGDYAETRYLLIDRRTLAFTAFGSLGAGDASNCQKTHHFTAYRYLKYEFGEPYRLHFFRRTGDFGYLRQVWRWDVAHSRFVKLSSTLVQSPPKSIESTWNREFGDW